MASLAPSTHPGPVCAVLVLIFCGVLVAPSRGAGIQARHDRSIQLGDVYTRVKVSRYGILSCEGRLEAGTSVSFVTGCLDVPGAGAWEAADGSCRQCPEAGFSGQVCVQEGMEFLEGSSVRYTCGYGFSLDPTGPNFRNCTSTGWTSPEPPMCINDNDPQSVCPFPPIEDSPCNAVECGQLGVRDTRRGVYYAYEERPREFISQCNGEHISEPCTKICPETIEATTPTEEPTEEATTAQETEAETMRDATTSMAEAETVAPTEGAGAKGAATDAPNEVPTTEVPTEEATTEAPTPEAITEAPTEEATTEAPTEEATTEAPTEEATTEAPTEEVTTEAPTEEATTEAPTEEATTEAPTEEATTAAPTEEATQPEVLTVISETERAAAPPLVPDVFCTYKDTQYPVGTVLTHHCPPGWRRHNGRATQVCKASGLFHGNTPSCINIEDSLEICPPVDYTPEWSTCNKECVEEPGTGEQFRVLYNLEVTVDSPLAISSRCTKVTERRVCRGAHICQLPCEQVSVTNADIHLLAMGPYPVPVREGFSNGTLIEVECHKFYTPSHHPVLTCHNGRWDSDIPTCDLAPKHTCSKLRHVAFGRCLPEKDTYIIGEHVVCTCQANFGNTGSAIRYCTEDNRWTGQDAYCSYGTVMCGDPGRPDNGLYSSNGGFAVGSTVRYYCKVGFALVGQSTLTCQRNGKWNHDRPTCVYRFQDVHALAMRLGNIPNLPCEANGDCQCMAQQFCPECAFNTVNAYEMHSGAACCGMCKECCLELVFALDESGSITDKQFQAAVNFIKIMTRAYLNANNNRRDCLRVGGIKFAHKARVVANLTSAHNFVWPEHELSPRGGGTGIRCALKAINKMLAGSRRNCRKVAFLITDGRSNHCGTPRRTADTLKCDCTELYVVGIGSNLKLAELDRIASAPSITHLLLLQEFNDLIQLGTAFGSV